MSTTIVLVNPPFFDAHRPSLALGILQAVLRASGLESKVLYANLAYAEHIGLREYESVNSQQPQHYVGDWIFAESAFPRQQYSAQAFLSRLSGKFRAPSSETLLSLRCGAPTFIDSF